MPIVALPTTVESSYIEVPYSLANGNLYSWSELLNPPVSHHKLSHILRCYSSYMIPACMRSHTKKKPIGASAAASVGNGWQMSGYCSKRYLRSE